jgi:hypothetical protein
LMADHGFISLTGRGFNSRQSHVTRSASIIFGASRPGAGLAGVPRLLLLDSA